MRPKPLASSAAVLVAAGVLTGAVSCTPAPLSCTAHAPASPVQNTIATITVKTVAGALVTTAAHYQDAITTLHSTTNALGLASTRYNIGNATTGYKVKVVVSVQKGVQKGACSTAFTPQLAPPIPPIIPPPPPPVPPVIPPPPALTGVPSGRLIVPANNTAWGPSQIIPLQTNAVDPTSNPGFTPGVTVVEWWLYSDKTLGDTYTFADQYPGNTENKIFLGESRVPFSGTTTDGIWRADFTVPTNGQLTVTRDGQSPGGLAVPRTYLLPPGTYSVQSHLQNAWWLSNMGVETGKTAMNKIELDAGVPGA